MEVSARGGPFFPAAAGGLLKWQRNTKFCQRCGSPVRLVKAGHKATCTAASCGASAYPILMPAVLTLCTCGDYALLGRNSRWPRGFYSCLAGFVDQSESLEQAVAREVLEESGIVITPVGEGLGEWGWAGGNAIGGGRRGVWGF